MAISQRNTAKVHGQYDDGKLAVNAYLVRVPTNPMVP